MEKEVNCDDVAGGDGQEEVEMNKFFELLEKLREARKRLRDQQNQVIKTTKSFDDLYYNCNNTIDDDVESNKGTNNTNSDHNDNNKKKKVKSERPSSCGTSCWIGSFEKEDFFSNRQSSCDRQQRIHSTSSNESVHRDDSRIEEQPSKRHHNDKPVDGRLNLNLTL